MEKRNDFKSLNYDMLATVKRLLCVLLLMVACVAASAQTRILRGKSTLSSDILYTVDGTVPAILFVIL